MTSQYPPEMDADSVASSPRSDVRYQHETLPRVRFMCSFGGKILPRPHDNQLRYVGGDTRIVAVARSISFSSLLAKLSKLTGSINITVKYQLPNEDLDSLISVTTDEDVENMMDEYERVALNQNPRSARLRLFLFPKGEDSRASSMSSLLDGSANRENWFVDAINSGMARLERGRSEASSVVSEVPDYLFISLDNSDDLQQREPRARARPFLPDNVSNSDPGSPAPVVSSPFCSTSSAPCVPSAPSIPNLPPVRTKPDNPVPVVESKQNQVEGFQVETGEQQRNVYPGNPGMQYAPESSYSGHHAPPVPVYYVQDLVPPGKVPVQVQSVPMQAPPPYVQPYHGIPGQVPIGYHHLVPGVGQVYGGGMRPVAAVNPYDASGRVVPDGARQQVYHAVPNPGTVPVYPVMAMRGADEPQRVGRGTNPPSE
ncbi:hypothetical protein L6164_036543 [Bauhinia variegata]|uniref:Uncharacterized protein n=1 Tax=Bauhinia variegata TaxID=167791 RepID=A0ACB9KHE6_BAUVA|nr:hypothetical protein L6164_036543 [Bauhinia variegata]